MKRCSAQDLQRIYGDAPQELTDAVCQKLEGLPEQAPVSIRSKSRLRTGLIAAAILLAGLVTIAFSTGAMQKLFWVNWNGDVVETQEVKAFDPAGSHPAYERARGIQERYPEDRVVWIRYPDEASEDGTTGLYSDCSKTVYSMESFTEIMKGSGLTYPHSVPEGYHFSAASVTYKCAAEKGYTLEEKSEEDGYAYSVWSLAAADRVIYGYMISFRNNDNMDEYIRIDDTMSSGDETTPSVGLLEDEQIDLPEIQGFDNALINYSGDITEYYLRRMLPAAVSLKSVMLQQQDMEPAETAINCSTEEIRITFHGAAPDLDRIPGLFGLN